MLASGVEKIAMLIRLTPPRNGCLISKCVHKTEKY